MQTFLPYPDPAETARCLRTDDLLEQINDVLTILGVLHETESTGWALHPVVKMWAGYDVHLGNYGLVLIEEATHRTGLSASVIGDIAQKGDKIAWHLECATSGEYTLVSPRWMTSPDLHEAHRSELLRRDPMYYRSFFPTTPMDVNQYWPVD